MPEVKPSDIQTFASIKVVGVGGAGGALTLTDVTQNITGTLPYSQETALQVVRVLVQLSVQWAEPVDCLQSMKCLKLLTW